MRMQISDYKVLITITNADFWLQSSDYGIKNSDNSVTDFTDNWNRLQITENRSQIIDIWKQKNNILQITDYR